MADSTNRQVALKKRSKELRVSKFLMDFSDQEAGSGSFPTGGLKV
jgi:hypothetical protein